MHQLEKVKEEVLPVSSGQRLIRELYPAAEFFNNCKFAYLAYINTDKKLPVQGLFCDEIEVAQDMLGFKKELELFLRRSIHPTFMELLFFMEIYHSYKTYRVDIGKVSRQRKFKDHPVLDNYFNDTHGYVLWHYQLENLLRVFSVLADKAKEIRKGLNRNDPECWALIKQMQFVDDFSLFDIYTERMVVPFVSTTSYPQFRHACNLFNLLKNT